jgi:hypothetical protein
VERERREGVEQKKERKKIRKALDKTRKVLINKSNCQLPRWVGK